MNRTTLFLVILAFSALCWASVFSQSTYSFSAVESVDTADAAASSKNSADEIFNRFFEEIYDESLEEATEEETDLDVANAAGEVEGEACTLEPEAAPAAVAAPVTIAASKSKKTGGARSSISIASFNIQVFGPTKMSKPEVRKQLIEIIKKFSVVFVQEIRDASQTAIYDLLADLNAVSSTPYRMVVSSREGKSVSKEQYAYIYRSDDIQLLNAVEFNDVNGWYERPPYGVKIRTKFGQILFLVGVHVSPKSAVSEIDHLDDIYQEWRSRWIGTPERFIIMGDLNAGCSYVTKNKWDQIRTRTKAATYTWIIRDNQVTTTVGGGECPYDRFIIGNGIKSISDPNGSVFNFTRELNISGQLSREISDHYPIFMNIYSP